jgi:hypothetical protein
LISLASMAQVFILNMTFDIPVKLLSFHLLVMSLVLLAPQARRLANVLVFQKHSEPASQPDLFASARANGVGSWVQAGLGLWALIGCLAMGWQEWQEHGGGRQKPPLYGIWSVTEYTVDAHPVPPLATDQNRWHRLVFDEPDAVTYQRMNGELVTAAATVDDHAVVLPELSGKLNVTRPSPDQLRLDGRLDGRSVTMSLQRVDLNSFTLRNRGFKWVQDYPYFR